MRSQKYVFSQRVTTKTSIVFRILFWSLLVSCCYQLLFPLVGGRLIQYAPQWAVPISVSQLPVATGSAEDYLTPFWYNGLFGAIDSDGHPIHLAVLDFAVSYSDSVAVQYPHILDLLDSNPNETPPLTVPAALTVQDSISGFDLYQLPSFGYPVVHGEQVYVISSSGDTISAWYAGSSVYSYTFASPILSSAHSQNITVLSLFDGRVVVLDENGVERGIVPTDAQYDIVPAVAISDDEERMAFISKGEDYMLYYYDITEPQMMTQTAIVLPSDAVHQSFPATHLQFVAGGNSLFVNVGDRLWLYQPTLHLLTVLERNISLLAWDGNETMLCAIYEQFNIRMIGCYGIQGQQLFSASLPDAPSAPTNSLSVLADSSIVIGSNEKLYALQALQ